VADHTRRAQDFLKASRRIEQVVTDYDILDSSIKLIKAESTCFEQVFCSENHMQLDLSETSGLHYFPMPSTNARAFVADSLASLSESVVLIRSYNRLWRERARIGINECFALVNQQDAEVFLFSLL
jgi:hypothetical protein